jgi:hypothetical protein
MTMQVRNVVFYTSEVLDLNNPYSIYWASQIKIFQTPTFKCNNENKNSLQNFGVDTSWGQSTTTRYN